jgi:SAM-dependent methyltransferase
MRVLELGSGAGDVSMLVARIVGQEGGVVGVESSAEAIATARRRVEDAGFRNVTLLEGDIRQLDSVLDQERLPFDALVGRLVLQFTRDPVLVLRGAADRVRPGGLVCFQEGDDWYTWAYPASPLWERVRGWVLAALEGAQIEQRMGLRLYQTFLATGLPAPELRLEAAIGGGEHAPASLWAGIVPVLLPVMEQLGIATAADVDRPTLAERLLTETLAHDGVVIALPLIGAWTRTPNAERSG